MYFYPEAGIFNVVPDKTVMDQGKLSDGTATLNIFNLHSIQESLIEMKRSDILFKKHNRTQLTTLPGVKYSIDGTDIYICISC